MLGRRQPLLDEWLTEFSVRIFFHKLENYKEKRSAESITRHTLRCKAERSAARRSDTLHLPAVLVQASHSRRDPPYSEWLDRLHTQELLEGVDPLLLHHAGATSHRIFLHKFRITTGLSPQNIEPPTRERLRSSLATSIRLHYDRQVANCGNEQSLQSDTSPQETAI